MGILGKLFRGARKLNKSVKKASPVLKVAGAAWLGYGVDQGFNKGRLTGGKGRTPTVKPPAVVKPTQPAVAKPTQPAVAKPKPMYPMSSVHQPHFSSKYYSVKAAEETIRQLAETARYGKSSKDEQRRKSQGSSEVMKGSKKTAAIEVSAFRHALDIGDNYDTKHNPRKEMAVWMAAARAAEGGGLQYESGEWYTGAGGTPTWGYLTGETKGAQNIQSGYNPPKGMFTPKDADLWKYARQQYGFTGKGSTNAKLRHKNYVEGTNIGGHQHSKRIKAMIASGEIKNDWISAQSERRTPTKGENLTPAEEKKNKHFVGEFKKASASIFKRQKQFDLWKSMHQRLGRLPWKQ